MFRGKLAGQSNLNLWFTSLNLPDQLGPNTAEGAIWLNEPIKANETSEPFLLTGWDNCLVRFQNNSDTDVQLTFEVDKTGKDNWSSLQTVTVVAQKSTYVLFSTVVPGEWIRIKSDKGANLSAHFSYSANDTRTTTAGSLFAGLSTVSTVIRRYGLGANRRALGMAASTYKGGQATDVG